LSRASLTPFVAGELEHTLAGAEGSFSTLASKIDPLRYVQWMKEGDGLCLEIADPAAYGGEALGKDQLKAITDLGFRRGDPNFALELASLDEAAGAVTSALVDVFGIERAEDLEVSSHTEVAGSSQAPVQVAAQLPTQEVPSSEEFPWFRNLSEVPGVNWAPPTEVSVGPPLSTATPVVQRFDEEPPVTLVTWIDEDGARLPDNLGFGSPADSASRDFHRASNTDQVLQIVWTALSLPGTRYDYFRVTESGISELWRQEDEEPARARSQESLALLGIALLKTGLEETVIPPLSQRERGGYLGSAASPYRSLIQLYTKEGFLQEAAVVFEDLQHLPAEARERAYIETDPRDLLTALGDLNS
jgi:hypothetical protein